MREHYRQKHPDSEIVLQACPVQSVASKPVKKYIGVEGVPGPQDRQPVATPASSLRESMLQVLREPVRPVAHEASQVPRLVLNLGWDVNRLGEQERQALLQHPEGEGQPNWPSFKAVKGYFLESMGHIDVFDSRIKILLRDDCHGFRRLQENSSKERYVHFMARFIWFAMNCLSEACIVLTADLGNRLAHLKGHLNDIESELSDDSFEDANGEWTVVLLAALECLLAYPETRA